MTSRRIFVAGHQGMVGSAIVRLLADHSNQSAAGLAPTQLITRTRNELDLSDQSAVNDFFASQAIDQVYLAAARVGGIHANGTYPAEFIYENLLIAANVIHAAHAHGVQQLLFLGSSCIYPRLAPQPIPENALLCGPLEPTNEPYAIAKIAGIKLCESYNRQYGRDYRSVMPTNLYGPGDNYHPENSHVIPALIRRFHEAKQNRLPTVRLWGTGQALREFLYVDDLATACVTLLNLPLAEYAAQAPARQSHLNIGSGDEFSIAELARRIADVVAYHGDIEFDHAHPDGAPRKRLDLTRLQRLGFRPQVSLEDGLAASYADFVARFQ